MNNLHRDLAPITDVAWSEIEEEATRTFKRYIAGRRVVDMPDARGMEFSALGTGHVIDIDMGFAGVRARRREVLPVVEFRVPFTVSRDAIDDVERGSADSDWQPVKDAAITIACAEDRTIFYGSGELGLLGIAAASPHDTVALPDDDDDLPAAIAGAVSKLRLEGVDGPYNLLLPAELYTLVAEATDDGNPILDHIETVLRNGNVLWAPTLTSAVLMSSRGGDYELHLGQDLSIGYLSHDAETVTLYLEESMTFRLASEEAAVRFAES